MLGKCIILLATAALLSACAASPDQAQRQAWNGGVWNSMLGYVGPANTVIVGGP